MLTILEEMQTKGMQPNAGTYSKILDAALLGGQDQGWAAAKGIDVFEQMPSACRNTHSYACVIQMLVVLCRGAEAGKWVERAKAEGLRLDAELTNAAVCAASASTASQAPAPQGSAGQVRSSCVMSCPCASRALVCYLEQSLTILLCVLYLLA